MSKNNIERPNSGGLALFKKFGSAPFKKMANTRWAKHNKQKKEWERQNKKT